MRTPSLHRRVVGVGVLVVFLVGASANVLLHLTFRSQLLNNLNALLDDRANVVRDEATVFSDRALAERLTELGIRATVRTAAGDDHAARPPSPVLGGVLPSGAGESDSEFAERTIRLGNGSTVTVFARRSGVDSALRWLLFLECAGLVGSMLLAGLLLLRTSELALRPLRLIADSARRTAAGERGHRLNPDRPNTSLGKLATAYDDMVDSLEESARRANEALADSELLYLYSRQTIETANAAFIAMDAAGRITDWNSTAERTFGWSRKEAVGRDLGALIIPPLLREAHYSGLERFLNGGEHRILGATVELEGLRRDGSIFPLELSTWVTDVGDEVTINGFVRDITDRRAGEEAIAQLAAIVASAQEAIVSTTVAGTIVTWNSGAERIYQYSADDAIGRHISFLVPPGQPEPAWVDDEILRGRSVRRHETVRRRMDGTDVDVAVTVSPIFDAQGSVTGASAIARDITEQRRIATALDNSLSALEGALEEARRSEERSRMFLADAAHQLRSPICGVRACAETLLLGASEVDRDELLADLVRETSRAGRLIASLLRLARVDGEAVTSTSPYCDVVAVCQSEIDRARVLGPQLDFGFLVEGDPGHAQHLDENALREILSNLLENARRHAASRMDVGIRMDRVGFTVSITDDGAGIPPGEVERIFERFVSLDGRGGSGLGLPIARALARAHGGDLAYENGAFVLRISSGRSTVAKRDPLEAIVASGTGYSGRKTPERSLEIS